MRTHFAITLLALGLLGIAQAAPLGQTGKQPSGRQAAVAPAAASATSEFP